MFVRNQEPPMNLSKAFNNLAKRTSRFTGNPLSFG